MNYGIYTIDDVNLKGQTVLCRLDINSPLGPDGRPGDTTRIKRSLPTIRELHDKGAKSILMSHQGGDLEYHNYGTTMVHAEIISEALGIEVQFIDDVCGPAARAKIAGLRGSEVLMLDNVRYMAEELTLFETKLKLTFEEQADTLLVRKLAPLADLFLCDAFAAAHRSQPTLVGFPLKLPSIMGRLFENEFTVLSNILENPKKPCLFILGGAKVQDAFMMMAKVLNDKVADQVLTCGLVANIMFLAKGIDIGNPSREFINKNNLTEYIEVSKKLLNEHGDRIVLPQDFAFVKGKRVEVDIKDLPVNELIVDVGAKTVAQYVDRIKISKTIFINGPAGIFEKDQSEYGTKSIWEAVACSDAFSVVGGGDSITAINKFNLNDKISYVCTGGGAMVRFLSGEELPVVQALRKSALLYPL